jgi:hypothetical protein
MNGKLEAFRRDSVSPLAGQDTVFFSYRTIIPQLNPSDCLDTTNGSILGRMVYEKSDGIFLFFNRTHDTLTLKTQASLNETWKFAGLPQNGKLEAKVTSLGSENILGLTDMVKTISLQAKNSLGNDIPYYLNQQTIKVSQHYGLLKMPDTYRVMDTLWNDTTSYFLAGKTIPAIGIQPLTWQAIYSYEVGDEFHYKGATIFNGQHDHQYRIQRILSKELSVTADTLTYQVENCFLDSLPQPPPNITKTFDTLTYRYIFSTMNQSGYYLGLPLEFYKDYSWEDVVSGFSGKLNFNGLFEYSSRTDTYKYLNSGCWLEFSALMFQISRFATGLGKTYNYHYNYDMGSWTVLCDSLVYFQKGSETWGTPVSNSCNTLVGTTDLITTDNSIKAIPNPAFNYIDVSIPGLIRGSTATILLYDGMGRQLLNVKVASSCYRLSRQNLPPGIYYLIVNSNDNRSSGSLKIIFL